jgi:hypothetical protein
MRHGLGKMPAWRAGLIVLIALALVSAVAMRFVDSSSVTQTSVSSPASSMRHHMASDAAVFERPLASSYELPLSLEAHHPLPVPPHVRSADVQDPLYNRPPPAFSLL